MHWKKGHAIPMCDCGQFYIYYQIFDNEGNQIDGLCVHCGEKKGYGIGQRKVVLDEVQS